MRRLVWGNTPSPFHQKPPDTTAAKPPPAPVETAAKVQTPTPCRRREPFPTPARPTAQDPRQAGSRSSRGQQQQPGARRQRQSRRVAHPPWHAMGAAQPGVKAVVAVPTCKKAEAPACVGSSHRRLWSAVGARAAHSSLDYTAPPTADLPCHRCCVRCPITTTKSAWQKCRRCSDGGWWRRW